MSARVSIRARPLQSRVVATPASKASRAGRAITQAAKGRNAKLAGRNKKAQAQEDAKWREGMESAAADRTSKKAAEPKQAGLKYSKRGKVSSQPGQVSKAALKKIKTDIEKKKESDEVSAERMEEKRAEYRAASAKGIPQVVTDRMLKRITIFSGSKFYLRDDTALGDFFTSHSIQPCILSMTTCRHPAYTHPALSTSRDHSVLTNLSSIQTLPVPLLLGFSTGPLFYLSKQVWHIDLAPWQFFFASTVTFGAALAGITYGVLSASWEPGRDGTFWGVTEVKANIPILWQTILGKAAGEIETKWDDEWDDGK